MIDYKNIEQEAWKLLETNDIQHGAVDVKKIAERMGIQVVEKSLGNEISGFLMIEENKKFIGLDSDASDRRNRFTTAHELGHYILHSKGFGTRIDEKISFFERNGLSTKEEIEANAFAAALLMPVSFIKNQIEENAYNYIGDDEINKLADHFNVSVPAMTFRISNLEKMNMLF